MKSFLKILFLFFIPCMSPAQSNVKQSFIVVHVDASGKTLFRQKIYSYHFLNGTFTGRDELMVVDGRQDGHDYIRTDMGHNVIYDDRYLITGIGNIIDLVEKKVIFDGKAGFLKCSNDSAIFYTNDVFKGKFYSVYDFNTQHYSEVKDLLFKIKVGREVEYDKSSTPFKIVYYPQGKPKVVLTADAGYGQKLGGKNYVPDPPLFWLDNDNLLYANFNQANTEISFYKINVDSKISSLIATLPITRDDKEADLTKLSLTQIIMTMSGKKFYIDLDSQSVVELQSSKPINGFSYEFTTTPKGRMIKLNDKEIGRFHFDPKTFAVGDNIAGFVKELVIGDDHYQQGFMVWNTTKQSWGSVEADEVLTVVGWINED